MDTFDFLWLVVQQNKKKPDSEVKRKCLDCEKLHFLGGSRRSKNFVWISILKVSHEVVRRKLALK